jgi:hypothetical protein
VESSQAAIQRKLVVETNKFHKHITDQVAQILGIASLVLEGHDFDIGIHVGAGVRLGARLLCERRRLGRVLDGSDVGAS